MPHYEQWSCSKRQNVQISVEHIHFFRNRTSQAALYEIPWIPPANYGKRRGWRKNTLLDATASKREEEAVKLHKTLHIPDATVLQVRPGRKTEGGFKSEFLTCAGFEISNVFPNNVVKLTNGEIVFVESFHIQPRSDRVLMLGRPFQNVSIFRPNILSSIEIFNMWSISTTSESWFG